MNTTDTLVFRIDDKLLQHRPPRLTLATTLSVLSKQIKSGELDANFVVNILHENHLLPYVIGRTNNLADVALGCNTNASKVGDLIVSEECIRGTYELCIAFLEFILNVLCNHNYRDTTKTMVASVSYIANEICTSHYIWTYKNINDMNRIMCLCIEIFHQIIIETKEPIDGHKYSDLEIICILSLSQNQAHKQIIDMIVEGKNNINKKTGESRDNSVVISVRQSLSIFNKLLLHSKYIKDYCSSNDNSTSPNQYQHGASSSDAPMTNIERALFDTSIRPGLLQHIFSYIYQKEDSTTACIAVDLVKNIAKKFSMSLMACLGSEADRVCQFFLECLSSKESNVELVVAILDLLSTCVKDQPGLIELFLDFKLDSKQSEGTASKAMTSLEVVMNLFIDCKNRQEDAHKLLHTYVMKFILTFWQKQHSAIERFDKADQFWESVNHPLLKFLECEQTNDEVCLEKNQIMTDKLRSYALMILARELFCLNSGMGERKMNANLMKIFKEMSEKNLLSKYSNFVKTSRQQVSTGMYKREDYNLVLFAWRDFLSSHAKFVPFEIEPQVRSQIVVDLLSCMAQELRLGEQLDKERISATGDTLLLVWTKGMGKDSSDEQMFNSIRELLHLADSSKNYLPFSFLLTFQSTLNLYLVRNSDYLANSKSSFDLLPPALQLMHFSLNIMIKYLNEHGAMNNAVTGVESNYKASVESRLCMVSITTLRLIMDVSKSEHNLWLTYIEKNIKTDSLLQTLTLLMDKHSCSDICQSLVDLLLCLSSISINTAIEFLSIYCIRICELLELLRTKPRSISVEELLQMIHMIDMFQLHGSKWKKRNKQSYGDIAGELAKTARSLASSAQPPPTMTTTATATTTTTTTTPTATTTTVTTTATTTTAVTTATTTTGGLQAPGGSELTTTTTTSQLSNQETYDRIFWILTRRIIHLDKTEVK